MKTKRWILAAILCVCLIAAGLFVWKQFFSGSNANPDDEASVIETDGEIVIVIPDEQGDDGF